MSRNTDTINLLCADLRLLGSSLFIRAGFMHVTGDFGWDFSLSGLDMDDDGWDQPHAKKWYVGDASGEGAGNPDLTDSYFRLLIHDGDHLKKVDLPFECHSISQIRTAKGMGMGLFGHKGGVIWQDGELHILPAAVTDPSMRTHIAAVDDADGEVWGVDGRYLYRFQMPPSGSCDWEKVCKLPPDTDHIAVDGKRILVGGASGIHWWMDGKVHPLNGSKIGRVMSLSPDGGDVIACTVDQDVIAVWCGTAKKSVLIGKVKTKYRLAKAVRYQGKTWLITGEGLYRLDRDGVTPISAPAYMGSPSALRVASDRLQVVYDHGVLLSEDGAKFRPVRMRSAPQPSSQTGMDQVADKELLAICASANPYRGSERLVENGLLPRLLELVSKSKITSRHADGAATIFGYVKFLPAEDMLVDWIAHPDESISDAALRALGKMQSRRGLEALIAAIAAATKARARTLCGSVSGFGDLAAEDLTRLVDQYVMEGIGRRKEELDRLLSSLYEMKNGLPNLGQSLVRLFKHALADEFGTPDIDKVLTAIRYARAPEVAHVLTPHLIKAAKKSDDDEPFWICDLMEAVGACGTGDDVQLVEKWRLSKTSYKRLSAIKAMADCRDERFRAHLIKALTDRSTEVREAAVKGMGHLGTQADADVLAERFMVETPSLRINILWALGAMPGKPRRDIFSLALEDSSKEVVETARKLEARSK